MNIKVKAGVERDNVVSRRAMLRHLVYQAGLICVGTVLYPHATSAIKTTQNNKDLLNCQNPSRIAETP